MSLVRATRSRYDGRTRNPWNEYECGSYYARAMSSYALLNTWSGFRYSAVEKTLWLAPASDQRPFRTFFSTATGYGTISLGARILTVLLVEGHLAIRRVVLNLAGKTIEWDCKLNAHPGTSARIIVPTGAPAKRKA